MVRRRILTYGEDEDTCTYKVYFDFTAQMH
jgi:hypothetical protein